MQIEENRVSDSKLYENNLRRNVIKHELLEKSLVEKGYTQKEAHKIASKMYNYGKEAEEYYDRIKKYKKE
nr:MAG TPA: argininosuccinate lyase [Caudoviricetes sp.]